MSVSLTAADGVPGLLTYQGRVAAGNTGFTGAGQFKFALVNGAGTALWRNAPDVNADGEPDAAVSIGVAQGLYAVALGDATLPNMAALPPSVFANEAVYLRAWFSDGVHGMQLLAPDQRVTAAGYAMMAATVPDGALGLEKLSPQAINALEGAQSGAIAALTSEVATLSALVDSLGGDVAGIQASVASLSTTVAGLSSSASAHGVRLNGLDASVASLNSQVAALNLLTANHGTRLTSLEGSVGGLNTSVAGLNASLAQINSSIAGLGAQLAAGMTVVSTEGADANLIANGYTRFSTVPAPAWANGSSVESPGARFGHSAVWTGSRMIVWGGNSGLGNGLTASGGIYDPASDSWTATTPFEAPSARAGHTAVWAGDRMIVWGGNSGVQEQSGGSLKLAPHEWAPVSSVNAPEGRELHVAIWTGARLVVWGGQKNGGLAATSGIYNPASDAWAALNAAGIAPESRIGATAVWTGDRMIVWGGIGQSGFLNSGGQLPITGGTTPTSWSAVNLSGAPTARHGHTAVWTGSRMIVWGGKNATGWLGDGAAYDPLTDSWLALAATDAPLARSDHAALWTGAEMLALGGETSTGATALAAAFNPTLNRWRALSGQGGPTARSSAAAVWTGTELLVFGGRDGASALDALQRLDPQPAWHMYRKP